MAWICRPKAEQLASGGSSGPRSTGGCGDAASVPPFGEAAFPACTASLEFVSA